MVPRQKAEKIDAPAARMDADRHNGKAASVLLVTTERPDLRDFEKRLQHEGHKVAAATTLEQALSLVRRRHLDIIMIDPSLRGGFGFDTVHGLRAETSIPIMVIGSSNQEVDKIVALELGADDYVAMPLSVPEVLARMRRLIDHRRSLSTTIDGTRDIQLGSLKIDLEKREVTIRGKLVDLRPREFELLALLAGHPGRVFTREQLLGQLWGYESFGRSRTVDVHIDRLRRKLGERRATPGRIVTVRGVGYRLDA